MLSMTHCAQNNYYAGIISGSLMVTRCECEYWIESMYTVKISVKPITSDATISIGPDRLWLYKVECFGLLLTATWNDMLCMLKVQFPQLSLWKNLMQHQWLLAYLKSVSLITKHVSASRISKPLEAKRIQHVITVADHSS